MWVAAVVLNPRTLRRTPSNTSSTSVDEQLGQYSLDDTNASPLVGNERVGPRPGLSSWLLLQLALA